METSSNKSSPEELLDEAGLPAYSPDGVDLTLIRWMLEMTPVQRLDVLQAMARFVLEARAANDKA